MLHEIKPSFEGSDGQSSIPSSKRKPLDLDQIHAKSVQSGGSKGKLEDNPGMGVSPDEEGKRKEHLGLSGSSDAWKEISEILQRKPNRHQRPTQEVSEQHYGRQKDMRMQEMSEEKKIEMKRMTEEMKDKVKEIQEDMEK